MKEEQLGYFLAGFVEGEGSFNVSLRRKADYKVNWQVVLSFNVSQKDLDVQLALLLKINSKLSETHKAINDLRSIRNQINSYIGSMEDKTRCC